MAKTIIYLLTKLWPKEVGKRNEPIMGLIDVNGNLTRLEGEVVRALQRDANLSSFAPVLVFILLLLLLLVFLLFILLFLINPELFIVNELLLLLLFFGFLLFLKFFVMVKPLLSLLCLTSSSPSSSSSFANICFLQGKSIRRELKLESNNESLIRWLTNISPT